MSPGDMEVLRNSIARATEDIARDRDEWRAIATDLATAARPFTLPGYSDPTDKAVTLLGAALGDFDRKAASEE